MCGGMAPQAGPDLLLPSRRRHWPSPHCLPAHITLHERILALPLLAPGTRLRTKDGRPSRWPTSTTSTGTAPLTTSRSAPSIRTLAGGGHVRPGPQAARSCGRAVAAAPHECASPALQHTVHVGRELGSQPAAAHPLAQLPAERIVLPPRALGRVPPLAFHTSSAIAGSSSASATATTSGKTTASGPRSATTPGPPRRCRRPPGARGAARSPPAPSAGPDPTSRPPPHGTGRTPARLPPQPPLPAAPRPATAAARPTSASA